MGELTNEAGFDGLILGQRVKTLI